MVKLPFHGARSPCPPQGRGIPRAKVSRATRCAAGSKFADKETRRRSAGPHAGVPQPRPLLCSPFAPLSAAEGAVVAAEGSCAPPAAQKGCGDVAGARKRPGPEGAGAPAASSLAREAAVLLRWLFPTPTPAEPLRAAGRAPLEAGGAPLPLFPPLLPPALRPAPRAPSPDVFCAGSTARARLAQPGGGSAGRVNPEECGGRNVHADEMDANLMLMSGGRGRPGLSRAPRAQTAAGLRRQPRPGLPRRGQGGSPGMVD